MKKTSRYNGKALLILLYLLIPSAYPSKAYAATVKTSRVIVEYDGLSERYARMVMESAERNLPGISRALGQELPGTITITLADTPERFRELTEGRLPDWSAAVAMPERRIVFSPLAGQKLEMERILAHEMVHVVINEAAGEEFVPRWFHEGCAELLSGEWNFRNELYMAWKVTRGDLMTFDDIQEVFSTGSLDAGLAYDQSMLAVRHLVSENGRPVLARILDTMRNGSDFPEAFLKATGYLPTQYEDEYIRYLRGRYGPGSLLILAPSTWTFMMVLFLVVYVVKRRRTKRKLAEWEREEASMPVSSQPVAPDADYESDILDEYVEDEYPEDDFSEDERDNILPFKPRPRRYGGEGE